MYAPVSSCSGDLIHAGLRDEHDRNDVLVCRAQYGRLRKLRERELDALERFLILAFAEARGRSDVELLS
jgi:hypothetical protein